MNAGILKIGTMPPMCYFIKTNKKISEYKPGDKIAFREQQPGSQWERGVVRENILNMPRVERM